MGAEYKGIRLCVSRANLAQHVEGRSIAVDGGVPPWYRPPWARREPRCQVWCEMAFCMKKDEDHLPGRVSISIAWLMAGGPPGTCLRLPVRCTQTGAVTHRQVWGPHKTRYRTLQRRVNPPEAGKRGDLGVGPPRQSPGHPLRLPSTSLRSAQGDPSKTSLPSGPHPERGPTARDRGPSRGVGIIDPGLS